APRAAVAAARFAELAVELDAAPRVDAAVALLVSLRLAADALGAAPRIVRPVVVVVVVVLAAAAPISMSAVVVVVVVAAAIRQHGGGDRADHQHRGGAHPHAGAPDPGAPARPRA